MIERARAAFRDDAAAIPAMTLRGGAAVDGYDERSACRELAMQVLEEYWVPNALYRRRPATGV